MFDVNAAKNVSRTKNAAPIYKPNGIYVNTIGSDSNILPELSTIGFPSVFVYTLPNIVTGEIAIRNKFFGETNFLVLAEKDEYTMNRCIQHAFQDPSCKSVIAGWLNCNSEDDFEAEMRIIKQKTYNMEELILKLKQEIIEVLNLEDMKPEDIDENASLFGEGLGLDSIDALELIVLMEKNGYMIEDFENQNGLK